MMSFLCVQGRWRSVTPYKSKNLCFTHVIVTITGSGGVTEWKRAIRSVISVVAHLAVGFPCTVKRQSSERRQSPDFYGIYDNQFLLIAWNLAIICKMLPENQKLHQNFVKIFQCCKIVDNSNIVRTLALLFCYQHSYNN